MELKLYFSEEEMSLFLTNLGYTIEEYEYIGDYDIKWEDPVKYKTLLAYKVRPVEETMLLLSKIHYAFYAEMKIKLLAL